MRAQIRRPKPIVKVADTSQDRNLARPKTTNERKLAEPIIWPIINFSNPKAKIAQNRNTTQMTSG